MRKNQKKLVKILSNYYEKDDELMIFDIGARDGEESIFFSKIFPNSTVYSFECNPDIISKCEHNIKGFDNINLIKKAVSNSDDPINFYPIDCEKSQTKHRDGNPGASSIFKINDYSKREKYIQKEIKVQSITLKSFMTQKNIKKINILWMDTQGAELLILEGLEEKINDIDIIHTEVEFIQMYKNQPLFNDIKSFLNKNNFLLIKFTSFSKFFGDAVFINKNILEDECTEIRDKYLYTYYKYIGIYVNYLEYLLEMTKGIIKK